MREQEIQGLRRRAESAIADMADGDLKIKAFEVILGHLLSELNASQAVTAESKRRLRPGRKVESRSPQSCIDRILSLKEEGFFGTQRSIGEIKSELARHGWHYPPTTLSGKLQSIVRRRELRRIKGSDGKRSLWKYSEP
jgi:hypothetical protein